MSIYTRLTSALIIALPSIAMAQYHQNYFDHYLPSISTDENAVDTLATILGKLPPDAQGAFNERYLAMTIQRPNNDNCDLPANLAGVRRLATQRNDKRDILLFFCRDHFLLTVESITTIFLL